MISPATHVITEFAIPTANAEPLGITAGPNGNIWFTEENASKIGMINPTTHAITEFATGTPPSYPRGITVGPDGNLWFAERPGSGAGAIGMINPTTHAITQFSVPNMPVPFEIAAGPDGNLWFTATAAGEIGNINPTTHAITMFVVPPTQFGNFPTGITAGPDGKIWFADSDGNAIGMINPTTDAISEFAVPTANAFPLLITAGPDGNLWFTEEDAGKIGSINPTTDVITEYPVPYSGSKPEAITTGPDGNLWFSDLGTDAIGVATLATTQLVVTQQPPSTVTAGSPFGLTVDAEDDSGNLLSSFDGAVTVAMASNPGGATLGGTLTVTASDGVATFSGLTLNKAASGYTLQLSASGIAGATTTAVTVTPAAASQLVITEQPPASVTAGSGFGLEASIEDPYGNVVTSAGNVVTAALASNPTGATLGGTLSVTASNGVATFSGLTLTTASSGYTLQLSSSGLSAATSNAIAVTPAAARQVAITQQPPGSVVVNGSFGLVASVEDAYGNVVTSATSTVKVALASNPGGAKLGGTLSVKASDGVATFSGLTLNKVGSGYTLALSSSGLTGATTSAITVTSTAEGSALVATAASNVSGATAETSAPDPLLAPLVLDSPGFFESLGLKKRGRAT